MTVAEFFLDLPLYTKINVDESQDLISEIFKRETQFDGYNPVIQAETTFRIISTPNVAQVNIVRLNHFTIIVQCKRSNDQFHFYLTWDHNNKVIKKVGQYPSVADFHTADIKIYKSLLSIEKQKEFTRAMGLAANGVGIGSFVYLRRIFEQLINIAEQEAIVDDRLTSDKLKSMRMDERIVALSNYLPKFLVDNNKIYGILSKGIHELSEDDCLNYFDTLRVAIEIILDKKLEQQKEQEKQLKAKKSLDKLQSLIKQK